MGQGHASCSRRQVSSKRRKLQSLLAPTSKPTWESRVAIPQTYHTLGAPIQDTALRAIKLTQLRELVTLIQEVLEKCNIMDWEGRRVTWDADSQANLYVINIEFVKPLTRPFRCSFAELVADGPQIPQWFVSHWWGTSFRETSALLEFHRSQRKCAIDAHYWICTFANNQHDLGELGGRLVNTPFFRAIMLQECQGTVAILNKDVTTFTRIWCVLENYVSTVHANEGQKTAPHLYDLAAWLGKDDQRHAKGKYVPAKPTLQLDFGNGHFKDVVENYEATGGTFPFRVADKGIEIDLARAESTRDSDRHEILHEIAGTPADERTDAPPESCAKYDELNRTLHRRFAGTALYRFAERGNITRIKEMLEEFPENVDKAMTDGATPSHIAAQNGRSEALKLLIAKQADVGKAMANGATPSHMAAFQGHSEVLKLLIAARADVGKASGDGATPSCIAAARGHSEALQLLIGTRADVNKAMKDGATPILMAAQDGYSDEVQVLISARADPDKAPHSSCCNEVIGATPTFLAAKAGHSKILEFLIAARADVEKDREGERPIEVARQNGNGNCIRLLLAAGAD